MIQECIAEIDRTTTLVYILLLTETGGQERLAPRLQQGEPSWTGLCEKVDRTELHESRWFVMGVWAEEGCFLPCCRRKPPWRQMHWIRLKTRFEGSANPNPNPNPNNDFADGAQSQLRLLFSAESSSTKLHNRWIRPGRR